MDTYVSKTRPFQTTAVETLQLELKNKKRLRREVFFNRMKAKTKKNCWEWVNPLRQKGRNIYVSIRIQKI